MERFDFIDSRIDVVKNMYTLYSYVKGESEECREWALQRFKRGRWYVVEPFGDCLLFAPSRFVGYKDNSMKKHIENHGDGTQTNDRLKALNLYKEYSDGYLTEQFKLFMISLGIDKSGANFFIPSDMEVADLQRNKKCYFICPTHCKGQKQEAWNRFLKKNLMAIGWGDKDYTDSTLDDIEKDYLNDRTAMPAFTLMKQIRHGDVVCCTQNNFGLWGIGVALSSYKYQSQVHYAGIDSDDEESYYSHYIDVAWLCFNKQSYIPTSDFNIQSPEKVWQPFGTLSRKEEIPQYILNYLLKNLTAMIDTDKYREYITLLKENKNLILTGAPGTGKTYLARKIAEAMNAECEFVQFHPSYDYTDFVEGLRPTAPDKNGNIGFERMDGVFKKFCKRAIAFSNESITLFEQCYNELLADINNGLIDTVQLKTGESQKLSVTQNNSIKWQRASDESDSINCVSLKRLFKLYSKYSNVEKFETMKNINDSIREIIGGANTTYYWAILREVLLRIEVKKNKNEKICDTFVFIIDEINRGEISKIFGELFFSIDSGYRGKKGKVKTQYQNLITDPNDPFIDGFYVPDNVYIIGTMNDIDRSVESMDFAMRRRFAWKEIRVSENTSMLDDLGTLKNEVVEKMNRLNNAIWNEETNEGLDGLSSAYHIGGAYFRKLKHYLNENFSNKEEAYRQLWNSHLRGLLFEYLRGSVDAAENMKMLEKVYFGDITND